MYATLKSTVFPFVQALNAGRLRRKVRAEPATAVHWSDQPQRADAAGPFLQYGTLIPASTLQPTTLSLNGSPGARANVALIQHARALYDAGERALVVDLSTVQTLGASDLLALYNVVRLFAGQPTVAPDEGRGALHRMADDLAAPTWRAAVTFTGLLPHPRQKCEAAGLHRVCSLA